MSDLTPAPLPEYGPPAPVYDAAPASPPKFRVHKFLHFLLKLWWVPVLVLLLFIAASFAYARHQPPVYTSKGSMWQTFRLRLPEGASFSDEAQNLLGTENDLLQSTLLRDRAIAAIRSSSNGVVIPTDADGEPLPVKLAINQSPRSAVFVIEATGSQAAYTRAFLEALMQSYVDYNDEIRKQVSGVTLDSITEQLQLAEQDLKSQQDALTAYERTNNQAVLQEEGSAAGAYLMKLKTQLSELELEEKMRGAATNDITNNVVLARTNADSSSSNGDDFVSGTDSLAASASADVQSKLKELEQLENQRAQMTNYQDSHPKVIQLSNDIERVRNELDLDRRREREQRETEREQRANSNITASVTARIRIETLNDSIKEWETNVVADNAAVAEAERLKINVQRSQGQYDELFAMMQNVKLSEKIDLETLAILEHASEAKRSHAQEISTVKSAAACGLLLGVGFIAFVSFRDEKFGSIVEINEKFGDTVIAQVPELPGLNGHLPAGELTDGTFHTYAESYRCLRSALMFLGSGPARPRVVLVTSALPDEGKSTVAANLAATLAQGGARVLLVDADLRRGALHRLLGLNQEPGLAELMKDPATDRGVFQINSEPNLSFLACGSRLNNPGDWFLSPGFDQLLARWRAEFDYVVMDSTPVFAADDATTLAPKMDGTLFIVRSRFSNARQVRCALDLLCQRGARVLGVVFNRADATARTYDYYKYAKYYPAPDVELTKPG